MNPTHEVFNQPAPLADYNLFETNRPLCDALKFNAPALDAAGLSRLGASLGSSAMQTHARLANVHGPVLHSHDRFGRRVDQVEFHPSYHELMKLATGAGLHGSPWSDEEASPHARRAWVCMAVLPSFAPSWLSSCVSSAGALNFSASRSGRLVSNRL